MSLHNGMNYNEKYYLGYQIRTRLAGNVALVREKRKTHSVLVGKPGGKTRLGIFQGMGVKTILKWITT